MNKMMMSGPMLFGFNLATLLLMVSGVFYILSAAHLWKPMREEKNELIGALFAFLVYQAFNMFFMGLQMQTMNFLYSNIAGLAIFIGSVYMLKFPLSSLSERTRKTVFRLMMVAVIAVFIWFVQTKDRQMQLMNFVLWYDLVVNGLIVGGFMIAQGFGALDRWKKIKAFGGGSGVISCCVAANGAMLGGAMLTGSIFGFAAPVLIILSLMYARKKQHEASLSATTA